MTSCLRGIRGSCEGWPRPGAGLLLFGKVSNRCQYQSAVGTEGITQRRRTRDKGANCCMTAHELRLYTWGYSGRSQADLFQLMTEHQISLVVDVREKPWSRDAQWRKAALMAAFGEHYHHLPELGNRTRSVQKVQLVNEERGLARLEVLLRTHRRLLLMCLERDHSLCHRSYVARRILERVEGLEVAHL